MGQFYRGCDGSKYIVTSVLQCPPGTVMATFDQRMGFQRVLIKSIINSAHLRLFYIDHGITVTQELQHMRFLTRQFAQFYGQTIEAQMWGLACPDGSKQKHESTVLLLQDLTAGKPGSLMAEAKIGAQVQQDSGLSLRLMHIDGRDIGRTMSYERLAKRMLEPPYWE